MAPFGPRRILGRMTARPMTALLLVSALAGCGGAATGNAGGRTQGGPSSAHSGRALFVTECGACHALAAAGTTGGAGPDLDTERPGYARVLERVTNGVGAMPAFTGVLTRSQIEAIARYVSSTTR